MPAHSCAYRSISAGLTSVRAEEGRLMMVTGSNRGARGVGFQV